MADSNEEVQARWGLKNEKEVPWDREKGLDADSAEQYRAAILEFISNSKESSDADELFATLMGEQVDVRRRYIEDHALEVKNLDV